MPQGQPGIAGQTLAALLSWKRLPIKAPRSVGKIQTIETLIANLQEAMVSANGGPIMKAPVESVQAAPMVMVSALADLPAYLPSHIGLDA